MEIVVIWEMGYLEHHEKKNGLQNGSRVRRRWQGQVADQKQDANLKKREKKGQCFSK